MKQTYSKRRYQLVDLMKYLLLILFIPNIVLASGTAEQYTMIWLVIILIIVAPILGFIYEKKNDKQDDEE